VLEVWLDLGELEDYPSNKIPGFNDRLLALLPALIEHHCGVGERGGFIQRLEEGTWAGHILEHVVIELLNLAGMPTGFGQTRSTSSAASTAWCSAPVKSAWPAWPWTRATSC
jgi:cyanophycin synthetase